MVRSGLVRSMPDFGFEQWRNGVANHFFTPESAGSPVTLFVDDDALEEIHPSHSAAKSVERDRKSVV